MSDLEITRQCAAAMKLRFLTVKDGHYIERPEKEVDYSWDGVYLYDEGSNMWQRSYLPLHDDAQAMALVKRFGLDIQRYDGWCVRKSDGHGGGEWYCEDDLNRAIVEYVSKMQAAK